MQGKSVLEIFFHIFNPLTFHFHSRNLYTIAAASDVFPVFLHQVREDETTSSLTRVTAVTCPAASETFWDGAGTKDAIRLEVAL